MEHNTSTSGSGSGSASGSGSGSSSGSGSGSGSGSRGFTWGGGLLGGGLDFNGGGAGPFFSSNLGFSACPCLMRLSASWITLSQAHYKCENKISKFCPLHIYCDTLNINWDTLNIREDTVQLTMPALNFKICKKIILAFSRLPRVLFLLITLAT